MHIYAFCNDFGAQLKQLYLRNGCTDVHVFYRPAVRIYNDIILLYEVYLLLKQTILQQNQNRSETRTNKIKQSRDDEKSNKNKA